MDFKQFYKEIIFDIDNSMNTIYSAKQGDTKSRGFYVTLTQNNIVVPVTTQTMTFYAEKSDGTRVYQNAIKDIDKFRIDLTNQVFAVPGIVKCELALRGGNGEKISSKTFRMIIDKQLAEDSIVSEDERGVIDDALDFVIKYVPRMELIDVEMLEGYQSAITTVANNLASHKDNYANYIDSELDFVLRELPNGIKDEIRVNVSTGKHECVKRTHQETITGSRVMARTNGNNSETHVRILLDLDLAFNTDTSVIADERAALWINNDRFNYSISTSTDTERFRLEIVNKRISITLSYARTGWTPNTYPTFQQIQDYFNANPITLIYQLAEPIITELALDDLSPNTQQIVKLTSKVEQLTKAIIALGGTII